MSQLDAVSAFGLLLQNHELRIRFASDRTAIIRELGVAPSQSSFFYNLEIEQLDSQAESLIRKRRAEVAHLIPKTWSRLGTDTDSQFQDYADRSAWPAGHRRHVTDADAFCRFLRMNAVAGYLASEHHWVSFLAGKQSFSARLLNDLIVNGEERWAAQFCFRYKGIAKTRAIHF